MINRLEIGMLGERETTVTVENTAAAFGCGSLEVFSTPAMIALMEGAAVACVDEALEPGQTTVGTLVEIRHQAATPVGMTIKAQAHLTEVKGRKLVFEITASDDKEVIGEGRHERYIVDAQRFLAKAQLKK